jgi:nicotinamide-nucleotide amidase
LFQNVQELKKKAKNSLDGNVFLGIILVGLLIAGMSGRWYNSVKAELISTGTELLLGQTLNSNAFFISQKLSALGINVYYHTTVGDNPERMEEAVRAALNRVDLVVTTGGLGPTLDDLTKQTVAKVLGLEQELHEESLTWVKNFFIKLDRPMPESNVKQAYFPAGSKVIPNNLGTAPGAIVEKGDKVVIILPGPPFEMKPMFTETVEPYLKDKVRTSPEVITARTLKVFGMSESAVEEALGDILHLQEGITIALLAKPAEIYIRIAATANTESKAVGMISDLEGKIRERLSNKIFAVDDEDMATAVGKMLVSWGLTLVTAESCTGGLVGGTVTAVPGSSAYYLGGFNTYSNDLKVRLLGVKQSTLDNHGAVCSETAKEMAVGARQKTDADLAVAVTGVAGPGGGTEEKPVGLVYIGLATPEGTDVVPFNFFGDRQAIRALSINAALDRVRLYLLNRGGTVS